LEARELYKKKIHFDPFKFGNLDEQHRRSKKHPVGFQMRKILIVIGANVLIQLCISVGILSF
jgi:hypothetical protein